MTVSFIRKYILKEQGVVHIPVFVSQNIFLIFYLILLFWHYLHNYNEKKMACKLWKPQE